jgi:hypothetical protein
MYHLISLSLSLSLPTTIYLVTSNLRILMRSKVIVVGKCSTSSNTKRDDIFILLHTKGVNRMKSIKFTSIHIHI